MLRAQAGTRAREGGPLVTFAPYSPFPTLCRPGACETVSGWLRCQDCGQPLRPRDDGKGWNCYGCDVLVTDDKELRKRFGGDGE